MSEKLQCFGRVPGSLCRLSTINRTLPTDSQSLRIKRHSCAKRGDNVLWKATRLRARPMDWQRGWPLTEYEKVREQTNRILVPNLAAHHFIPQLQMEWQNGSSIWNAKERDIRSKLRSSIIRLVDHMHAHAFEGKWLAQTESRTCTLTKRGFTEAQP